MFKLTLPIKDEFINNAYSIVYIKNQGGTVTPVIKELNGWHDCGRTIAHSKITLARLYDRCISPPLWTTVNAVTF
jgi:hypothetical protein